MEFLEVTIVFPMQDVSAYISIASQKIVASSQFERILTYSIERVQVFWFNSLFKVLSNILRSLEDNSGKLVARLTLGNDKICGKAEQFTRFWTNQLLLAESFKIVKM